MQTASSEGGGQRGGAGDRKSCISTVPGELIQRTTRPPRDHRRSAEPHWSELPRGDQVKPASIRMRIAGVSARRRRA